MTKACWLVTIPGYRPFPMVGGQMIEAEALAYARGIWPEATVQ